MSDPWLDGWREVGVAVREVHTDFAESAQGVATDGSRWFIVSNRAVAGLMRKITAPTSVFGRYRNTRRVGVFDLDGRKVREVAPDAEIWTELVGRNRTMPARGGKRAPIHLGAPAWARDTLLVPTQKPSGVWAISSDLDHQEWWPDPAPDWPERWSWLDADPDRDLLFTSLHWHPDRVHALRWSTLERVPDADIVLAPSEPRLDRVQGGAFVDHRLVLTSSVAGGRVHCYGARDGAWLGTRTFGDYFEMEGIAVAPLRLGGTGTGTGGGTETQVHILDAGTHYWPFLRWGDVFAVRSYAVPPPPGS